MATVKTFKAGDDDALEHIGDGVIREYLRERGYEDELSDNHLDLIEKAFRALAEGDITYCADLLRELYPALRTLEHERRLVAPLLPIARAA